METTGLTLELFFARKDAVKKITSIFEEAHSFALELIKENGLIKESNLDQMSVEIDHGANTASFNVTYAGGAWYEGFTLDTNDQTLEEAQEFQGLSIHDDRYTGLLQNAIEAWCQLYQQAEAAMEE